MGTFVKIDKRPWSSNQARFMQIRVELEIQKPLRRGGMVISPEGIRTWVHYRYERLPVFCYSRGVMGHEAKMSKFKRVNSKISIWGLAPRFWG